MDKNYNEGKKLLESLVGLDKASASKLCSKEGYDIRVIREDSSNYAFTMDLRFDRVNLYINDGVITKCDIG